MDNIATKYFKTSDIEEIEELYEQEIFELKQFFLSRAPIAKLFKGRLNKLKSLQEAFEAVDSSQTKQKFEFSFPEENSDLLESYKAFQAAKNKVRLQISNELNGANLFQQVQILVDLEKHNAHSWLLHKEIEEDESVVISKEPNPIDILNGIYQYQQLGGKTFSNLKRNENNPPNVLVQEMKRLSLLFKKF